MNTSIKAACFSVMALLAMSPLASHAETLQEVTDQGSATTNGITSAGVVTNGAGSGDFGGFPTQILSSTPDGSSWNMMFQNLTADATSPTSTAQWGQYVSDDGDLQMWSVQSGGLGHQFLSFVTPEQEIAFGTNGPGGVYMPEAGLVFGPFQSDTNDLGLPNAAWRNLYVGGVSATSVVAVNVTTTNLFTTQGNVQALSANTANISGSQGIGDFGGYPSKLIVTNPTEGMWNMVQQNATANANNPSIAETWGTFIANDGSYALYGVNTNELYMQMITQEQVTNLGLSELGGLYVGPTGGTLSPTSNNDIELGQPDDSWKNVYASGTVYTVGLDVSSQARLPSDTMINNTLVCLADGTNCPSMFMAQAQQIQVPPPAANDDVDGQAKISKGDTEVVVTFNKAYASAPAVLATPREFIDGAYRITNVTKNGFTIEFNKKQGKDVLLDWHASGIELKTVFTSKKTK
ncbi:MAG: hypothetical protein ABIO72_05660 [Patescibacteria group bacterium]